MRARRPEPTPGQAAAARALAAEVMGAHERAAEARRAYAHAGPMRARVAGTPLEARMEAHERAARADAIEAEDAAEGLADRFSRLLDASGAPENEREAARLRVAEHMPWAEVARERAYSVRRCEALADAALDYVAVTAYAADGTPL